MIKSRCGMVFLALGAVALITASTFAADVKAKAPSGSFIRFRVDEFPGGQKELTITAAMKIHSSPWVLSGLKLTPKPVTATGWTEYVDLRKLPGAANGSLILQIPNGVRGITRFSRETNDAAAVRDIDWQEPDGTKIIVTPDLSDVRTFREQERRYYLRSLQQTGDRLYPLARPPLYFSNAWGHTTGGAAEYMVKTFRLLGFNSVETSQDAAKYETLYGWHSQGGHYSPPSFVPYDEAQSRSQFEDYYTKFFKTGKGAGSAPGIRIFQLSDEPGEINPDPKAAAPAFRKWLAAQGLEPKLFGKSNWDEVDLEWKSGQGDQQNRLYYWSRRYKNYLTPKLFSLAAEGVRQGAPNSEVQSFVALSGHALYMPSRMSLDMFQLAQYPGLIPGISDWMTSGSWNWDSHQAVAFSVAPFNAGARRYGAEFGQAPKSFPMMHCVSPSLFRAHTQLANQCKLISYYTYGPDYESTEGFWSHTWQGFAVQHVNNQAAQVDDILGPGTMRPSRVAMLYSNSQEIWWPAGSFADKRAAFLALSHHYYQPELVTEEQVSQGALRHYDALYVLEQFVSRSAQQQIEDWVKGGGLLWTCADAAIGDEYNAPCDLLDRFAGLKRDRSKPILAELDMIPVKGEKVIPYKVPPLGRKKEIIRPGNFTWPDARVRANYADQQPAWAEKAIGKGKVVYVDHRCGLAYSRRAGARGEYKWWPSDGQREILSQSLIEAGIERELILSEPLVMASPISTKDGTVVILFNMAPEDRNHLTITLKEAIAPQSVQWIAPGRGLVDLPSKHSNGQLVITDFALPKTGAMIIVRRKPAPPDHRLQQMRQAAEQHLASSDWQTASAGAWVAGFFPEWKLAERLPPLLKHDNWAVRRSAAESIGRLRFQGAATAVKAALDRETDTHALADELMALVHLRHPEARSLCDRYRRHTDSFVRSEAERASGFLEK